MTKLNKKLNDELASKGRFGDTMVAHISTAQSKALLGDNVPTINPETGLPEYFWGSVISAGAGLLGGVLSKSGAAADAQRAQADAARQQAAIAKEQLRIGGEAGDAFRNVMGEWLSQDDVGSYGRFSADGFTGAQQDYIDYVNDQRGKSSSNVSRLLGEMPGASGSTNALKSRFSSVDGTGFNLASSVRDPALASRMGLEGDVNIARNFQGTAQNREGRFGDRREQLTSEILTLLNDDTDREMSAARDELMAELASRGMASSTAAIEAMKSLGAEGARLKNQNSLQAIEQALAILEGEQALDTRAMQNELAMDDATFGRMVQTAALGQTSFEMEMAAEQMGMTVVELRDQLLTSEMARKSGDVERMIDFMVAEQGLRFNEDEQFFKNRAMARGDYVEGFNAIPTDYTDAISTAFQKYTALQQLRGNTIDELNFLTSTPFALEGGFFEAAGNTANKAASTFGDVALAYNQRAASKGKMFGDVFNSLGQAVLSKFGG